MRSPRAFECIATGLPCMDGRCKTNLCMLEIEIPDRPPIKAKPTKKTELQKEAEKVAREWARLRKKRPTKEQIERAASHPNIVAEAERRIAFRAG
jgi:hypothetical protein